MCLCRRSCVPSMAERAAGIWQHWSVLVCLPQQWHFWHSQVLHEEGSLLQTAPERVSLLRFSREGGVLACQSAGKALELFRYELPPRHNMNTAWCKRCCPLLASPYRQGPFKRRSHLPRTHGLPKALMLLSWIRIVMPTVQALWSTNCAQRSLLIYCAGSGFCQGGHGAHKQAVCACP